mgnify:CR=1 FL=1
MSEDQWTPDVLAAMLETLAANAGTVASILRSDADSLSKLSHSSWLGDLAASRADVFRQAAALIRAIAQEQAP